jgi:hypothetical protein
MMLSSRIPDLRPPKAGEAANAARRKCGEAKPADAGAGV